MYDLCDIFSYVIKIINLLIYFIIIVFLLFIRLISFLDYSVVS